jgi:hypothetical protein
VRVAALVVDERALAGGVLDVAFRDRDALRPGGLRGELEDAERVPRVAPGAADDQLTDVVVERDAELRRPAPDDFSELRVGERLQLIELHP